MRGLLETYRPAGCSRPQPPTLWFDRMSQRICGWLSSRPGALGSFRRRALRILKTSAGFHPLSDDDLRDALRTAARELRRDKSTKPLDHFLSLLGVAVKRVHGYEPHPEQWIGCLALGEGKLAEMATGEGKTLVAALAALSLAARGRRCHVLTANDYLASRDRDLLAPLAAWCGLEVGCVTGDTKPPARAAAYAKPIVYSTAKDVLADFLRDRLAAGQAESSLLRLARAVAHGNLEAAARTLPPLDAAIVDEADHLLIDEAVTPLIISRKEENPALSAAVLAATRIAGDFVEGRDFLVDRQHREIRLLQPGHAKVANARGDFPESWSSLPRRFELVDVALQAHCFFIRDHHYVVLDGKVVIVDESTGRLMPDRQWQQGLHQAVEAKEGLEPGAPTVIAARMSFQRFFRLYRHLSGLTGTAWEARHELSVMFQLKVLRIPTHRPCLRRLHPDQLVHPIAKWRAICDHITEVHQSGRPVLAGTRTVADSERLRSMLEARGLAVQVLNAIHHEQEAEIVAGAGHPGKITIATNMAGRGTDIGLQAAVRELGGLHVVATERHASERIDRQLFGRSGRQGDPGSACAFISWNDEVMERHLPAGLRWAVSLLAGRVSSIERPLAATMVRIAQRRSGLRDGERRRQLLAADYRIEESLGLPPEVS